MFIFEDEEPEELYDPELDGISHINTYSKGKTELGRMLSNFYYAPFEHPEFGKFDSVEGFWYWYQTGQQHEVLRGLHGYKAKQEGKKYERVDIDVEYFYEKVLECIGLKIINSPEIYEALKLSTLPFVHYYRYGDENPKVIKVPCEWMMNGINNIRFIIKQHGAIQ